MATPSNTPPVFLDRRSYRRRRLMDAVRLLPVLGVFLWMLPLFWPVGRADASPITMSAAVIYVFAVWLVLVVCAFALWRFLRHAPEAQIGEIPEDDTTWSRSTN